MYNKVLRLLERKYRFIHFVCTGSFPTGIKPVDKTSKQIMEDLAAMNEALASPHGIAWIQNAERLAFLGVTSKNSTKQLSGSADEAVKNIAAILNEMLVAATEKKTAAEFIELREDSFVSFAGLMLSVSSLLRAVVAPSVIARLTAQSLCEQEAEFRDNALVAFGSAIRDQGMFTIWTLRKISDLSQTISSLELDRELKDQEAELAQKFFFYGMRTRFHLECLSTALRHGNPIFPEVLSEISNGLRSAVDAYAWIRQISDLYSQLPEPVLPFIDLDEEDRRFVDASWLDMSIESAA